MKILKSDILPKPEGLYPLCVRLDGSWLTDSPSIPIAVPGRELLNKLWILKFI